MSDAWIADHAPAMHGSAVVEQGHLIDRRSALDVMIAAGRHHPTAVLAGHGVDRGAVDPPAATAAVAQITGGQRGHTIGIPGSNTGLPGALVGVR